MKRKQIRDKKPRPIVDRESFVLDHELDASFLKIVTRDMKTYRHIRTIKGADGVWFLCPKCFAANGGPIGTHGVICWFVGRVPDDLDPKPGRWNPQTEDGKIQTLTFVGPGAASVALTGGCNWHGFVRDGTATLS